MEEVISVADRVWRRAVTMLFVTMRFEMELRYHANRLYKDDPEFAGLLWNCFDRLPQIGKELTQNESLLMKAVIGGWPPALHTQYSWHIEAVNCLLWCLEEMEMPPHDGVCDFEQIDKYFGKTTGAQLSSWTEYLLAKNVNLRDGHEIQAKLRQSGILYQRSMISQALREGTRKLSTKKYSDIFPLEECGLPIGPSGDLVVLGKEFCDLSAVEESVFLPVSVVRVQSLKWALDPNQDWDDIHMKEWTTLPK